VISTEQFPIEISVAGVTIYTAAQVQRPLVLPPTGALDQVLRYDAASARPEILDAVNAIAALDDGSRLRGASNAVKAQALTTRSQLSTDPNIPGFTPATSLRNQLKQISKFIFLRNTLSGGGPMRRQIFFASLGGFDTHANQNGGQGGLLTQ